MTTVSYGGDTIPKQTFFNLDERKRNRIIDCAIDEFSQKSFESAKLSNIIKSSGIPRGSLYQYFIDKKDLYLYLLELAKNKKMVYINAYMNNNKDVPFFDLFRGMYLAGIKFAIENPKLVKIMSLMLMNKNDIYQEILGDSLNYAIDYYKDLIDRDKEKGRIREDIDSKVFAKLIIDLTTNITVDEIESKNKVYDFEKMLDQVTKIMSIFEHGVLKEN